MVLFLDQKQISVWPAALILAASRDVSFQACVDLIRESHQRSTFLSADEISPEALKRPSTPEQVLAVLGSIWKRLESLDSTRATTERHAILMEIVDSTWSSEEQATLVAAMDYLVRLSVARKVARSSGPPHTSTIPETRSLSMQAAYLKLAGLAAADLPVWLSGERGTELEWSGRLIHRLRGLREDSFHRWGQHGSPVTSVASLARDLGPESSLLVADIEKTPESFQESLYRHLVGELGLIPAFHVVVSSGPAEAASKAVQGMIPELQAFLGPLRIDIPPLRKRIQDLPAMIDFLAAQRGLGATTARLTREALELLHGYHWPGNTEELDHMIAFLVGRRPAGSIRPEDLPETVRPQSDLPKQILEALEGLVGAERFRVLAGDEGRRRFAEFLCAFGSERFGAGEIQRFLGLGRETARRLLRSLEQRGLINGERGARNMRVTKYSLRNEPEK